MWAQLRQPAHAPYTGTNLCTVGANDSVEALEIFGSRICKDSGRGPRRILDHQLDQGGRGGFDLPLVVEVKPTCGYPWLCIPEGTYGLVQERGRIVNYKEGKDGKEGNPVWPPGEHMCATAPWRHVSHLVTKQFMLFDAPEKKVVTKDNVEVIIDFSIVFRIMGEVEVRVSLLPNNPPALFVLPHHAAPRFPLLHRGKKCR